MCLLNPIIPFTMDEVNQNYPLKTKDNVMYYDYPKKSHNFDSKLLENYKLIKEFRDEALKTLENERNKGEIGSAQEALLTLNIKDETLKNELKNFSKEELARLFIVSEVNFDESLKENENKLTLSKMLESFKKINFKKYLIFFIYFFSIVIAAIVIDQVTKVVAMNCLTLGQPVTFIPNFIEFTLVYNKGAAFGMGDDALWIRIIFVLLSWLVAIGLEG